MAIVRRITKCGNNKKRLKKVETKYMKKSVSFFSQVIPHLVNTDVNKYNPLASKP